MITPPTKSFFVMHIAGEAADYITNKFSPEVTSDIREAILISADYDTDIEAHHSLDAAMSIVQKQLRKDKIKMEVETKHNPLYVPASQEELENMLEGDEATENFKFVGFDENPFTMKSVNVSTKESENPIIMARVACHQFELPSYSDIMQAQQNKVLN